MKQNFGGHSNIITIYPICLYREKQAEAAEAGKTEKRKRSVLEVSDSEDNEVNWDNFHADQDLKIQDRKTESNRKLSIDPEMKSKLNELKPIFFLCQILFGREKWSNHQYVISSHHKIYDS